jgi:hypothetical protein
MPAHCEPFPEYTKATGTSRPTAVSTTTSSAGPIEAAASRAD